MKRILAAVLVVLLLVLAYWTTLGRPTTETSSAPSAAGRFVGPQPLVDAPTGPKTPPPFRQPETSARQQARVALAEAGGLGHLACDLQGLSPSSGAGLHQLRTDGTTLFALVREPDGQTLLRGRSPEGRVAVVGQLTWTGAYAGDRGDCWVDPVVDAVEHEVVLSDSAGPLDRIDAFRVQVVGCEGVSAPDRKGVLRVRAHPGVPCLLLAQDRATGGTGEQWVDAEAPTRFTLDLDQIDTELAGKTAADLRGEAFAVQRDEAAEWAELYAIAAELSTDEAVKASLLADRKRALTLVDDLEKLTAPN